MPRYVRHDHDGPIKIEPQEKPIFICACGLTKNVPFCDGSHKACKGETPGKVVVYDTDRQTIVEERDQG